MEAGPRARTSSAEDELRSASDRSYEEGGGTTSDEARSPSPRPHRSAFARRGVTFSSKEFNVPVTHDMFLALFGRPSHLTVFDLVTMLLWLVPIYLWVAGLIGPLGASVIFGFWRLAYNVGLGELLRRQSNSEVITRWFHNLERNGMGWLKRMLLSSFRRTLDSDYDPDKVTDEFHAWMAFRYLENVVLSNDVASYFVLCVSGFTLPEKYDMVVLAEYAAGVVLLVLNMWAKSAAHKVIGDYAWYWGDFFFRMDQELTFDGIFQLVPHPMYTVGYFMFYGMAFLTRSTHVLYMGLFAHMFQILFLVFCENPHIEKIYGNPLADCARERRYKLLSDEANNLGYFFRKHRDALFITRLDLYRPTDVLLAILLVYTTILYLLGVPSWVHVMHTILWRAVHVFGIGGILFVQSRYKHWTRHYQLVGRSAQEAFESFKALLNISITMNYFSFFVTAVVHYQLSLEWEHLLLEMIGVLLVCVHVWGFWSSYEVLGDVGWFYGDFFIEELPSHLCYEGVYRYLNNPDLVTGAAGMYGVALFCHSYTMFGLALLFHVTHAAFQRYVEKPHMMRLYGNRVLRPLGGIEQVLQRKVRPLRVKMNFTAEKVIHKMRTKIRALHSN